MTMLTWTLAIILSLSTNATPKATQRLLHGAVAPPSGCTEGALRQHPRGGARFLECTDGALYPRWCAPGRVFSAQASRCLPSQSNPRESGVTRGHLPLEARGPRYTRRSVSSSVSSPWSPLLLSWKGKTADTERGDTQSRNAKNGVALRRWFGHNGRKSVLQKLPHKPSNVPHKDMVKPPSTCISCYHKRSRPVINSNQAHRDKTLEVLKPPAYVTSGSRDNTVRVSIAQRKGITSALPRTLQNPRQGNSASFEVRPTGRASQRVFPFSRTPTNFKSTRKKCAQKLSEKLPDRILSIFPGLIVRKGPMSNSPLKHSEEEETVTQVGRGDVLFDSMAEASGGITRNDKEGVSRTAIQKLASGTISTSRRSATTKDVRGEPVKNRIAPPNPLSQAQLHASTATSKTRTFTPSTVQEDFRGETSVGSGALKASLPPEQSRQSGESFEEILQARKELDPMLRNIQKEAPVESMTSLKRAQFTTWKTVDLSEQPTELSGRRSAMKSSLMTADKMSSIIPDISPGTAPVATANAKLSSSGAELESPALSFTPAASSSTLFAEPGNGLRQVTHADSPRFVDANGLAYETTSSWTEENTRTTVAASSESITLARSYITSSARNDAHLTSVYMATQRFGATSPTQHTLAEADSPVTQTDTATQPWQILTSHGKSITSFTSAPVNDFEYQKSWAEQHTHATVAPFTESIKSDASYTDLPTRHEAGFSSAYVTTPDHRFTSPIQPRLGEAEVSFKPAETATAPSPILTSLTAPITSSISTKVSNPGYKETLTWAEQSTHAMIAPLTENIASPPSYTKGGERSEAVLASSYKAMQDHGLIPPTRQKLKETGPSDTQTETITEPSPASQSLSAPFTSSISREVGSHAYEEKSTWAEQLTHATVSPFTERMASSPSYIHLGAETEAALASAYTTTQDHELRLPTQQRWKETHALFTSTETTTAALPALHAFSKPLPSSITTITLPLPEPTLRTDVNESVKDEPLYEDNARAEQENHNSGPHVEHTAPTETREAVTRQAAPADSMHDEVRTLTSHAVTAAKPSFHAVTKQLVSSNGVQGSTETMLVENSEVDLTAVTTQKYADTTSQFPVEKTDAVSEATQRATSLDRMFPTYTVRLQSPDGSGNNNNTSRPDAQAVTFVLSEVQENASELSVKPSSTPAKTQLPFTQPAFRQTKRENVSIPEKNVRVTNAPSHDAQSTSISTPRILAGQRLTNQSEGVSLTTPTHEETLNSMTGFPTYGSNGAESPYATTSRDVSQPSVSKRTLRPDADLDMYTRDNESTEAYRNVISSKFITPGYTKVFPSSASSSSFASQYNASKETRSYVSGNYIGVSTLDAPNVTTETALQNVTATLYTERLTPDSDQSLDQLSLELHLSKSSGRSPVRNPLLTMHFSTVSSKQANVTAHSKMHLLNGSASERLVTLLASQDISSLLTSAPSRDEITSIRNLLEKSIQHVRRDDETSSASNNTAETPLSTTEPYSVERLKRLPGIEDEETEHNKGSMVIPEDSERPYFTSVTTMEVNRTSHWAPSQHAPNLTNLDMLPLPTQKIAEDATVASTSTQSTVAPSTAVVPNRVSSLPSRTTAKSTPSTVKAEEVTQGPVCKSRFGLFRHPQNCNLFVHCSNFIPYVKQCPANLHFNEKYMVCDYPYRAGCLEKRY